MAVKNPPPRSTHPSGGPLAYYEKQFIIQMGVLGNTRREIQDKFLAKYNHTVHERTITKVWRENKKEMEEARNSIQAHGLEMVTGDAIKQKTYRLIDRRLSRAEVDESEVEKLRLKFRAGELTKHQFDEEVARYEQLTINELVKLADMGFDHSHKAGEGPALTPEDQAMLGVLTEGLRNGNPLQLIQVLNPTINTNPNGGSQAPPAGTP